MRLYEDHSNRSMEVRILEKKNTILTATLIKHSVDKKKNAGFESWVLLCHMCNDKIDNISRPGCSKGNVMNIF